jgi:plastocyanin
MKQKHLLSAGLAIAFLLGAAVIAAAAGTSRHSAVAADDQAKATVNINGFKFEPKELKVKQGTTVQWVNHGTRHSVDADDGSFKSDILKEGDTFEHTFDKPGTYRYYCRFHGEKGGKDMAGKIVVTK